MNFKRLSKLELKLMNFAVKKMPNLIEMYRVYGVNPGSRQDDAR